MTVAEDIMTKEIKKAPKKNSPKKQVKGAAPMPPRGMALSFLMMVLFTLMYILSDSSGRSGELDYSEFVNRVKTGRIATVDIAHDGAGNHTIMGEAKDKPMEVSTQFKTEIISPTLL